MEVELILPKKELFIGSYIKVNVVIDPASGRPIEDLEFILPDGPPAGIISLSRDADFNPDKPDIMLCVGYRPGTYSLKAWSKQAHIFIAETEFVITDIWKDENEGPSMWFSGANELYVAVVGSAWGGGTPTTGPQNIPLTPTKKERRIAILLIDTTSKKYPEDTTTLQGIKDRWLNEIVRGVTVGGVTRSVAHYYREVSYNNLEVSAELFGPVSLTKDWDTQFGVKEDGLPRVESHVFWQSVVSAGDPLIDYNKFDTLLAVFQSVSLVNPDPKDTNEFTVKAVWPGADIGTFLTSSKTSSSTSSKSLAVIGMPSEWRPRLGSNGREIHETVSHELGHNLGLMDSYRYPVPMWPSGLRNMGNWDLMGDEKNLPHLPLVQRMRLGWISPSLIKSYNFQETPKVFEDKILYPIEDILSNPLGTYGIEVRISDGWNYYFEYRKGKSSQIGDRALPVDNVVLGTDFRSDGKSPFGRPLILLLNNDEDKDGSVLTKGKNYQETDMSEPYYRTPFYLGVTDIDGSTAKIHIKYASNKRPDPSIRTWPAGPGREWQSPDIEVRNARNAVAPEFFNVPWEGNDNTIIASIRNSGDADAPQVKADFHILEFNASGQGSPIGPPTYLGSDIHDIKPGETVPFTCQWPDPRKGHFCVVVTIPWYQTPVAAGSISVLELNPTNNIAQTNYFRFISKTSSLPSREAITVQVTNPYDQRTRVSIKGQQTNPLYRTFIENTSLTLGPSETKKVMVMFEYADDKSVGPDVDKRQYISVPNNVGICAFVEDPIYNTDSPLLLGGAQIQVVTGRSTKFQNFDNNQSEVRGIVVTSDDEVPVPGGKVILKNSLEGKAEYVTLDLTGGQFSTQIMSGWQTVKAYYIPIAGYADCESVRLYNESMFHR